ncbi:MAG TPA: hypothetical protein DIU15_02675 [Deltaproteobacteria bacterium]|nr:hypothetical protein [Deltaproteobacteria bacterium]
MDKDNCSERVRETFGDQTTTLVAISAADQGPLFRPQILEAVDRVCEAFEDEMTDYEVAVKCLTSVPIMEARPVGGARVLVAREEFPFSPADAIHFQQLVLQLEFSRGDVVDRRLGGKVTYIHLPHASFDGVSLTSIFDAQAEAHQGVLEMTIDDGTTDPEDYTRVAQDGPSAGVLVGLYDAGEDGALKEPSHLLALERYQLAVEAEPKVVQTFTIADDIKMVRRGLHKGLPGEAFIPPARPEVSQLLLALSLAPSGNLFGPRMDSQERVGLLRINLAAMDAAQRKKLARKLDAMLARALPAGSSGFLCLDD